MPRQFLAINWHHSIVIYNIIKYCMIIRTTMVCSIMTRIYYNYKLTTKFTSHTICYIDQTFPH